MPRRGPGRTAAAAAARRDRLTAPRPRRSERCRRSARRPVCEEHHGDRDPRRGKPPRPGRSSRPERRAEREHGRDDERPADQVVQEGGPREQPAVLLVDEESRTRDDQRSRGHERPVRRVEPPAHDGELHRARGGGRLCPERVGDQVQRGEGREDRDHPQPHPGEKGQRGPEARAPGALPGRQARRWPQRAGRGRGRGSRRRTASGLSRPGSISALAARPLEVLDEPGATRKAKRRPTSTTRSGGRTAHSHNPFPSG